MLPNLTPKQAETYKMIIRQMARWGRSPTGREVADEMGVAHTTAVEHIVHLKRKGFLDGASHGIRLAGARCPACGHSLRKSQRRLTGREKRIHSDA